MKTAEQQVIDFLRTNPSWFASAELQRLFFKNKNGTNAAPRSIVRRLEENTPSFLEVKYIGGNAYYKIREEFKKREQIVTPITLPDGTRGVRVTYA